MSDDGPMHFSELQVTNYYFFVDLLIPRDNQGPGMSGEEEMVNSKKRRRWKKIVLKHMLHDSSFFHIYHGSPLENNKLYLTMETKGIHRVQLVLLWMNSMCTSYLSSSIHSTVPRITTHYSLRISRGKGMKTLVQNITSGSRFVNCTMLSCLDLK